MGIADPHFDFMRLQPERVRDGVGDDGAAALTDILRRRAGDQAAALDGDLDRGAGLPDIKPVAAGDANAATVAAGLRRRILPVLPDVEIRGPIVKPPPVGVGVPSLA